MSDLLDLPAFPLAVFVKLAPVDRPTIENWMRSGSLVPAKPAGGEEGVLGGHYFSLRNLLKIEVMQRLRDNLGMQPRSAAVIADALIVENEKTVEKEFAHASKHGPDSDLITSPVGYGLAKGEDGLPSISSSSMAADSFVLFAPMARLTRIVFAKYQAWSNWAAAELPALRAGLEKAAGHE